MRLKKMGIKNFLSCLIMNFLHFHKWVIMCHIIRRLNSTLTYFVNIFFDVRAIGAVFWNECENMRSVHEVFTDQVLFVM